MNSDVTFDVIKQDLDFEIRAINLYYKNLFRVGDKKTRETLMKILLDSLRHALTLGSILGGLEMGREIEEELSNEELKKFLEKGLKEETDSEAMYEEHLKLIKSDEIIKKIRPIFGDEILHEKLVKDILKGLK